MSTETTNSRSRAMRQYAGQGLKFALAGAVAVYLIRRGDIAWEPLRESIRQWQYSVPAFILLAMTPLWQFWRWQCLLRASGVRLPHREVFSYLMFSKFINMAFPGYLSGDILRGFFVSRRAAKNTEGQQEGKEYQAGGTSEVVTSILFDRLAGIYPLFALCMIGLIGTLRHPMQPRIMTPVGLLAAAGLLVPAVFVVIASRVPELPRWLLRWSAALHLQNILASLHSAIHRFARNGKLLGKIIGISFLNQSFVLLSFVLFGFALETHVPVTSYLMLVPIGLMVTAIPISPAGLGVGQIAFLGLFHTVGASQGANLFTLYMATYVLINSAGAFLFPMTQSGTQISRRAILAEIRKN